MSDTHNCAVCQTLLMGCVLINARGAPPWRFSLESESSALRNDVQFQLLRLKLKAASFSVCYTAQKGDESDGTGMKSVKNVVIKSFLISFTGDKLHSRPANSCQVNVGGVYLSIVFSREGEGPPNELCDFLRKYIKQMFV